MIFPDSYHYITGLTRSLDALYRALELEQTTQTWSAVRDAFGWIYRTEAVCRNAMGDKAYYQRRAASSEGEALGGLIWVRGLVEHRQAQVQQAVRVGLFDPNTSDEMHVWGNPGTGPSGALQLGVVVWPQRSTLPPGDRTEEHGRDLMYDTRVAGRPLMAPLREALDFLSSI